MLGKYQHSRQDLLNDLRHRIHCYWVFWFTCSATRTYCCSCYIGVLRPFDTFHVISGAISYPIHTVPGQASYAVYPYLVHTLSPVTDNCSSWISAKERMAVDFFHGQSPRNNVAGREDRTRDRSHTRWPRIRSSYRARQHWPYIIDHTLLNWSLL